MLSKAEIRRVQALSRASGREKTGLFVVEGVRLVEELLASPVVPLHAYATTSLEDTPRGVTLLERLRELDIVTTASYSEFGEMSDTETPQGVLVVARAPQRDLESLVLPGRGVIAVLDAIQDPGNFGSIVRSAHAFGASAVVTLPGTVDPWNSKAVRSAAGSSLHVPIVSARLDELRSFCAVQRITLAGAHAYGQSVDEMTGHDRIALVLGNEGAGISADAKAACDTLVSVPMRAAESLNVGVAAGILLYVLTRMS